MLREITAKFLQVRPRQFEQGRTNRATGDFYTQRCVRHTRTFLVSLECRHQVDVPFGRHPQVGRRMRCAECAAKGATP